MEKAYSALAKVYEKFAVDADYEAWAERVVGAVRGATDGVYGADCACGSGFFTRALKKGGFEVCGVDISREMLTEAERLTAKEGLRIPFFLSDMTTFRPTKKLDFITVVNDGINYLSPQSAKRAFTNFFKALNRGGALLFDVSSEYKIRNTIGNETFCGDDGDSAYLWFNRQKENSVEMEITVFTREGELFRRRDEFHEQFIHTSEFLVSALKDAGFDDVSAFDFDGGAPRESSTRLGFIAKKA